MPNLQFPPQGDAWAQEIPQWLTFYCADYSTFSASRTRSSVIGRSYNQITIPYPMEANTSNTIRYTSGGSMNVMALEKGLVGTIAQQITATKEMFNSFFSGSNVIRFDHFETIFEPGARRTHAFNINLIAKNAAQSLVANEIALIFQNNMYPTASTESILTMRHPPLWAIRAFGSRPRYWDGEPLVSVLSSVDINRSQILNIPFASESGAPLAVNIKLIFIELEPAMQTGGGGLALISRSERFARGG